MRTIKIDKPIGSESEKLAFDLEGYPDAIFSSENISKFLVENEDEKDISLEINCPGGSTAEGLASYDILRTSGRNISANITGGCHSMAVVLLLSASKENRTANPNARALIHPVQMTPSGTLNSEQLRELADIAEREQNAILDIYVERTGTDRETLEGLMKEERQLNAQELLKYGFISKINSYSSNYKKDAMEKRKDALSDLVNKLTSFGTSLKNLLEGEPANYEFTDIDGVVMFTTEKSDDSIAVGDAATPAGTFILQDGRTVVIEDVDGMTKITDIQEPQNVDAEKDELIKNQTQEIEELKNKLSEANNLIVESTNALVDLKSKVTSNYQVRQRITNPGKKDTKNSYSSEDAKDQIRNNLNKIK